MTQLEAIGNHLVNGNRLTRHIALLQFDCANLTAVISEIRKLGIPIKTLRKRDAKGRLFAEYRVPAGSIAELVNDGRCKRVAFSGDKQYAIETYA